MVDQIAQRRTETSASVALDVAIPMHLKHKDDDMEVDQGRVAVICWVV